MRTLVYVHRNQLDAALALVAELRAEGVTALHRDTRGFNGEVEACDRVVTDDPTVAATHEARGIEVLPFSDADVLAEEAFAGEGEHHVEQNGTWWKLIGPDGEQVGKSQRSEADAWALLEADE